MKKKWKKAFKWIFYYPVLGLVCFELALLILGYRRYQNEPYSVSASPENAYVGDRLYGIALNPGTYTITLNDSVRFNTTHQPNNRRKIPFQASETASKRLALLGCSFTYGYGVNDTEPFAAQLQKKHADWVISNEGVIGYGTVQSFLQLEEIAKNKAADVVVLNFSSFHFMRNVLSQTYRKNLKMGYAQSADQVDSLMQQARFPYVSDCSGTIQYATWENMHENWTGRTWFALVNWVQTFYESYLDKDIDEIALTACLIENMCKICQQNDIKFGIVCLDTTSATKNLHSSLPDLPWLDIGFNFTDTNLTHLPYDSHPNAAGHQFIAGKMENFLVNLMRDVE